VFENNSGDLVYSINVLTDDLEADNSIDASVTATDDSGNEVTADTSRSVDVDTDIEASITIDVIAGDDILNAEEGSQVNTTITGTVGGDVQAGDEVTLTVNGNTYTGDVFENDAGNLVYSIDVLTNDLETDHSIDASVTTTDIAGNSATAESDRTVSLNGDGFGDRSEVLEDSADLSGNVFESGNHFGENPQIESFQYTDETGTHIANAGETVTTLHGGELTVNSNGQWSYTPPESADHTDSDTLDGAGFNYTVSIDGGNTYTASHEISVLDQEPEALADVDNVNADVGESTSGNVLTGTGGNTGAVLQDDNEGPDDAQVTEVRFGDQSVSFDNGDDIQTDGSGNHYLEIEGDNGLLKLYQDGSYSYDVTSPTTTQTVGGDDWEGVELKAFNFGTAYKDIDGKLQLDQADGNVITDSNGLGVEGTQNGMPVGDQINHDADTGESEALAVNFTTPITQATVSVSNFYHNDNGGDTEGDAESGRWEAFDVDGNLVGFGVLDGDTIDYNGHGHQGTAVIELPDGGAFSSIVFTSTAYDDPLVNTEDSSDYFIQGISYEEVNLIDDEFTYVITDGDGDSSETTLTIDMKPPEADTVVLPDPVEASITIDVIAGDDVLNVHEAAEDKTTITGTVGKDVEAGDTVTLTVNGEYYKGDVFEQDGQLVYEIEVDTDNLEADNEIDASVSIKNAAGDIATATTSREINTEFSFKLFATDDQGEILLDGDGNPLDATEISEPGTDGGESTGYYVVKAVDAEGNPLAEQPQGTVDVTFANGDDISDDDYSGPGTQTVNVDETFTATANDDALSDSGEDFTVSLNDGSFSNVDAYETVNYDTAAVTTTILDETDTNTAADNDSAYTLKLFASDDQGNVLLDDHGNPVDATQIHEDGGTSAYYVVKALDDEGDFVDLSGHVNVSFNNHSAESNDYSTEGSQVTLGEAFSATANNDYWTDNGETFTVELVENSYSEDAAYNTGGAYETVDYDDATVTTTIRDLDIAGVEDNANTQEGAGDGGDWDISILENLDQIHSEDDFSSITVSDIPDGATLKDGDGNTLTVNGGEYTTTNWQDALELTITPAEDSSKDIELDYQLTLQDGSVASFTQSIVITPEADQPWTLGDLTSESVTYQDTLLEDVGWVSLDAGWTDGSSVFDELSASTGDADGSESNTYVRMYTDGDANVPSGTQIRFENAAGNIQTYTFKNSNTSVDIPADNLDSLQIKTPSDFNGELSLKIKTGVIDWDENSPSYDYYWSDDGETNQIWGEPDTLTINVSGDADLDANLISVTSVIAPEDSGRDQNTGDLSQNPDGTYDVSDAIDLEINYRTGKYTDTEVIEVKIEDIPADTFIFDKDGNLLNGDGSDGSLSTIKIVLDPSDGEHYTPQSGEIVLTSNSEFNTYIENLKLIPAHDSNEDFTLTLNQKSTEPSWDGSVGGDQTKEITDTFEVQLTGVADSPVVSGTDTPIELTESGEWQDLSGFQIASGEEQHFTEEVYALIRNVPGDVGLRVVDSDGNEVVDQLVLANVDGSTTDWRIDNETLQKIDSGEYGIQLKTPDADMSGSIELGIRVTVLDVDPNSGQSTDTLVSDHTMNIVIQPEIESYGDSQSSGYEDQWIDLNLGVDSSDGDVLVEGQYSYNGNDYDLKIEIPGLGQTSESIQIQGDNLVIDYSNNLVYLNQEDLSSVEVLTPLHSNDNVSDIQFYRYLKDDMDDGSTSDEDIQEVVTGHTVHVSGVADGWEDTDNPDNSTTDDTLGSDNDGFVVEDVASSLSVDTLFEMGGYQGDGYNQMLNTGKLDSANAPISFTEGKGFGVAQDGQGNGGAQSDALDQNESIGVTLDEATSEIGFTINLDAGASIDGAISFYDADGDKVGEIDIQGLSGSQSYTEADIQTSNGLNGNNEAYDQANNGIDFSYVVFDASTSNGNANADNGYYIDMTSVAGHSVDGSNLTIDNGQVSYDVVTGVDNINTALTDIVSQNVNVEDSYHDTVPGTDTSESEYYVIQNQSDAANTTWMVENGINAGDGVWVVPADAFDSASIKILQSDAGDGSLDLEIIPVSKENDGDILFDQPHTFTIEYAGGSEDIAAVNGGALVIDGSAPIISVSEKDAGQEDTVVDDIFGGTTASGAADLSYVVSDANNGSVDTSGMYKLPDGSFVGVGEVDFNPDANFNGDAGFDVEIIATDGSGNQSIVSESVTLDIDPVLDEAQISADGGTEIDNVNTDSIDLNIQIASSDTDSSEALQGDITITPQSGGLLTGTGVTDNGDGSYTVSPENLGSVAFVPDAYSHGNYSFEINYTRTDSDANGNADVTETITDTFSINIASEVDQIEVSLAPVSGIDEATDYPLDLSVLQHDSDGSEIASVKIAGVPDALIIQDASGNKIGNYSDNGDGTVNIVLKGSEIPDGGGLSLHDTTETYGGTFTVEVSAFSLDSVTKDIAQDSDNVTLTINPIASAIEEVDIGSAQTNQIIGIEDNAGMPLDLDVIMTDLDGSEKLQITFGDEFASNGFSATYIDGEGDLQTLTDSSYLTAEEAQSIQLVPQDNYSGDIDLTVNVQSVEVDAGGNVLDTLADAVSQTVQVSIDPEADNVTVDNISDLSVSEDTPEVNLGLSLTLDDDNEVLNINLDGLEPGSLVSVAGQNVMVGNSGSVGFTNLTEAQVEALSVTPPENYSGTMNVNVSVKTVDGGDVLDTAVTQSFNFEVTPEADDVEINNVGGLGTEDSSVNLGLDLVLADSAELLNVTLSGQEPGSTISIGGNPANTGTVNADGSITFDGLTLAQAESLQIAPPGNYSGTMDMHVSVETVDGGDVLDTAVTQSFNLEVTAEADRAVLHDPSLSNEVYNEDDDTYSYDLNLSASLTDDSEELSLRVDGIPDGSSLANIHGDSLNIVDGSITLTPDQLSGLTLTSPEQLISDGAGGLHLEATAISTEDMGTPNTGDDVSAVQTKTIVDGVMDGLAYVSTSGLSGFTDEMGSFNYIEGDTVTFKIGDVIIGDITPDGLEEGAVFLQDMADVSRSDLNDEYVENMAVFLQSLDEDGNPDNNITITPETHAAFEGVELDLRTASEADVKAAIESIGNTAVSEEEAMDHVQRMLEQYGGQTEFDEHIDDSIETASLAKEPIDGLRYETTSGLSGELTDGIFQYDEGDTVDLYSGDQLVASFDAADVGSDALITFDEAGFKLSLEELESLASDPGVYTTYDEYAELNFDAESGVDIDSDFETDSDIEADFESELELEFGSEINEEPNFVKVEIADLEGSSSETSGAEVELAEEAGSESLSSHKLCITF
jgi:hypothetical protein